jgi:hypothetical protein
MKARFINNEFASFYSNDFLEENKNKNINGDLVSNWDVREIEMPILNNLDSEILKEIKYQELLKTDWYFVRLAETGQEVPKEVLEQRNLIRNR